MWPASLTSQISDEPSSQIRRTPTPPPWRTLFVADLVDDEDQVADPRPIEVERFGRLHDRSRTAERLSPSGPKGSTTRSTTRLGERVVERPRDLVETAVGRVLASPVPSMTWGWLRFASFSTGDGKDSVS